MRGTSDITMKNIMLLFTLFLIGYVYEAAGNPCDGELFSLGCKMFEMVKKSSHTRKKDLDKRLSDISSRDRNDTIETRLMIDEGVQVISSKHNDDIKMVTKVAEEKFKLLKHLLDVKLNETTGKKINKTLVRLAGELSQVKKDVTLEINNSTTFYKKGLKDLEDMMKQSVNILKDAFKIKFLQIEKQIGEQYESITTKLDNAAKEQRELEEKIHNNTVGYKKGLVDLTSNLETYKNTTKRDLKVKIARVETEVDEKYATLKKEMDEIITKTAEDLEKEMEKKIESKYESLEKEVNSNISKVEGGLKKTIESDIDQKYEKMKKEVSVEIMASMKGKFDQITQSIADLREEIKSKAWPDGHYCLYMWGSYCPHGFTKTRNHYRYYCCK